MRPFCHLQSRFPGASRGLPPNNGVIEIGGVQMPQCGTTATEGSRPDKCVRCRLGALPRYTAKYCGPGNLAGMKLWPSWSGQAVRSIEVNAPTDTCRFSVVLLPDRMCKRGWYPAGPATWPAVCKPGLHSEDPFDMRPVGKDCGLAKREQRIVWRHDATNARYRC